MDAAFWQVARQHWLQYGAYDDRTVPYLGACERLARSLQCWLIFASGACKAASVGHVPPPCLPAALLGACLRPEEPQLSAHAGPGRRWFQGGTRACRESAGWSSPARTRCGHGLLCAPCRRRGRRDLLPAALHAATRMARVLLSPIPTPPLHPRQTRTAARPTTDPPATALPPPTHPPTHHQQVVMHDLASADSRDFSRAACFESKAPTCLAFLLLNLPTLAGYGPGGAPAGGGGGAAAQVRARARGGRGPPRWRRCWRRCWGASTRFCCAC